MDPKAKQKARKAERRYVRRTLRHCAVAAAVIFAAICIYALSYPAILRQQIRGHIKDGNFEAAMTAIARVDDENQAQALDNQCRYAMAAADMAEGRYEAARTAFLALGDYEDARQKADDCAWENSDVLFAQEDYSGALKMLLLIPDYPGVDARSMEVKYHQAGAMMDSDPMMAFSLYQSLGEYLDSAQISAHLAMEITGAEDMESAMAQLADMSQAQINAQLAIVTARDSMRPGSLCVGAHHTVGLKNDGTLLAAGRNEEGQCNVSGLSGVTQIAAGAYHTAALHADGTVSAVGRNEEGQCQVSEWQNVVQIACGDYATFALFADGTVAATGYLDYEGTEAWRGVTRISAGSYLAAGIYGTGEAYFTHPAGESEGYSDLLDVALTTGGSVGLTRNGEVTASFDSFPGWSQIAMISAGSRCVLGIDVNGRVMAHFFRAGDAFEVSQIENAACVAAGGQHSAVLLSDGTVVAFGNNESGQCDVSGWQLH